MRVLGIDEAGRGPVIGPMVLCGYMIEEEKVEKLRKLGAKDSKLLTDKKRRHLAPKLKKAASDYVLLKITAEQIDYLRTETNLNRIEIAKMQEIISLLRPDRAIIDSPEVNTKKFGQKIMAGAKFSGALTCENFADKKYPEVGAASILAKVSRDDEIKKLHKIYGDFGSGYSHDERTIAFLKDWIKDNKEFPPMVRKSWITAILMKEEKEQKRVGDFSNVKMLGGPSASVMR